MPIFRGKDPEELKRLRKILDSSVSLETKITTVKALYQPKKREIGLKYVELLTQAGRNEEAIQVLKEIAEAAPKDLKRNTYERALNIAKKSKLLDEEIEIHKLMGDYKEAAKTAEKRGAYTQALEIEEEGATRAEKKGEVREAINYYLGAAGIAERRKETLKAAEFYRKAAELAKRVRAFSDVRLYYEKAAQIVGETTLAIECYEKAGLPFKAAEIANKLGKYDKVKELIFKVMKIYQRRGKHQEIVTVAEKYHQKYRDESYIDRGMKILEEMGLLHIAAFLAGKAGYPLKAIAYFERAGSEWYGEILKILEEAPGIPDKKKLIATFLLKMEDYYHQRPSKQNEYVEKLCDLGQYRQALKFLDKVKEYLKAAILAKKYGEIELAIQFYLKQGGSWVRDAARLILSTTGDYKRALTILYREKERLLKLGRYGDAALLVRQTGAGSESEARELYQRELEKLEREKRYREAAELARKVEDKESEEIYTGIAEIVEESNKDL